MAAGYLPAPGTKLGPCVPTCGHVHCAATRKDAETPCHYCERPIGYEKGFYQLDERRGLAHAVCHEEAVEAEMAD